jgi:hypothetical protein
LTGLGNVGMLGGQPSTAASLDGDNAYVSGTILAILRLLHDASLPLVLVGDPDQAIYAWRGAEPQALGAFAA